MQRISLSAGVLYDSFLAFAIFLVAGALSLLPFFVLPIVPRGYSVGDCKQDEKDDGPKVLHRTGFFL